MFLPTLNKDYVCMYYVGTKEAGVTILHVSVVSALICTNTVAPRYNEPRCNEDPVITNNI